MSRIFLSYVAAVFMVSCALSFVHAAERSFGEHGHTSETCQFCAGQHHDRAATTAGSSAPFFPEVRHAAKTPPAPAVAGIKGDVRRTRAPPLLSRL